MSAAKGQPSALAGVGSMLSSVLMIGAELCFLVSPVLAQEPKQQQEPKPQPPPSPEEQPQPSQSPRDAPPDTAALFAKYQEAQKKHLAGEIDAARTLLAEIVAADPKNFDLALAIAKWLEEQRSDFIGAEPIARRAAELRPESVEAVNLFGSALTMTGKAVESEPLYAAAVIRAPAESLLWFGLAVARAQQQKHLEARPAFERAIELAPQSGLYHFSSGENLANLRELEAAEREFTLAFKLNGHADAGWRLGEILARQGKDVAAEKVLRAALNQGPKSVQWNAALQLGIFYVEHGRAQEAAGLLHQATTAKPEGRDAWMWLARAQRALGKSDAAARSIKKYQTLRASDDKTEEEYLLSLIRAQLGAAPQPSPAAGAGDR